MAQRRVYDPQVGSEKGRARQNRAAGPQPADGGLAKTYAIAEESARDGRALLPISAQYASSGTDRFPGIYRICGSRVAIRVGDQFVPRGRTRWAGFALCDARSVRRSKVRVARDRLDDRVGHFARVVPVGLEPLLKLRDLARALDLDIELDVLGQARFGEVARPDQRLRADHLELGVRDVGLGVKLVAIVDTAINLALSDRVKDRRDSV